MTAAPSPFLGWPSAGAVSSRRPGTRPVRAGACARSSLSTSPVANASAAGGLLPLSGRAWGLVPSAEPHGPERPAGRGGSPAPALTSTPSALRSVAQAASSRFLPSKGKIGFGRSAEGAGSCQRSAAKAVAVMPAAPPSTDQGR